MVHMNLTRHVGGDGIAVLQDEVLPKPTSVMWIFLKKVVI